MSRIGASPAAFKGTRGAGNRLRSRVGDSAWLGLDLR